MHCKFILQLSTFKQLDLSTVCAQCQPVFREPRVAEVVLSFHLDEGKLLQVAFIVPEQFEQLLSRQAYLSVVFGVERHLVYWVRSVAIPFHRCHRFGLLPLPVRHHPVGCTSLGDQVLGIGRESQADVALRVLFSRRQSLAFPLRRHVEDCNGGLFAILLGGGHVSLVGAYGHGGDAFGSVAGDKLLRLLVYIVNDEVGPSRIDNGLLVQVADVIGDIAFQAKRILWSNRRN